MGPKNTPSKNTPPKKRRLTVEALGRILHAEFEADAWGVLDPFFFDPVNWRTDPHEGQDPSGVLRRVLDQLQKGYCL